MLDGWPTVFLSCSERFKDRVAVAVRRDLERLGIRALVISDEPLLPGVAADPDAKIDAYLSYADAFVGLCTPDDRLQDGSVQCRQNIVDEYQRARQSHQLERRILLFKERSVRLPSNLNPTYLPLDLDDVGAIAPAVVRQLQEWRLTGAERPRAAPERREPKTALSPAPSSGTWSLLATFADPYSIMLIERLLDGPCSQKELARSLDLSSATVSRKMGLLEHLGLVRRDRQRSPYSLVEPDAVRRMLIAVYDLEHTLWVNQAQAIEARTGALRRRGLIVHAGEAAN